MADSTLPRVEELLRLLGSFCSVIDIENEYHDYLSRHMELPVCCRSASEPAEDTDLIVSIGGDGTFLRTVRWESAGRIPIAGLNGGHLGYLTGWRLDDISGFAEAIRDGNYRKERRSLLRVESAALPEDLHPFALNEIAVLKECSANMISIHAEIDGDYLADYQCDGLIVSTPTGSTGYNLSAGGPIMAPQLEACAVTPVAPHSLNMRPLVVSSGSRLCLEAHSRSGRVLLSIDGRSTSLPDGIRLTIIAAAHTVAIVRPTANTFASTLREKLYWGVAHPHR